MSRDYLSIFESDPDLSDREKQAIRDSFATRQGRPAPVEQPQPGFPYELLNDDFSDEEDD